MNKFSNILLFIFLFQIIFNSFPSSSSLLAKREPLIFSPCTNDPVPVTFSTFALNTTAMLVNQQYSVVGTGETTVEIPTGSVWNLTVISTADNSILDNGIFDFCLTTSS